MRHPKLFIVIAALLSCLTSCTTKVEDVEGQWLTKYKENILIFDVNTTKENYILQGFTNAEKAWLNGLESGALFYNEPGFKITNTKVNKSKVVYSLYSEASDQKMFASFSHIGKRTAEMSFNGTQLKLQRAKKLHELHVFSEGN